MKIMLEFTSSFYSSSYIDLANDDSNVLILHTNIWFALLIENRKSFKVGFVEAWDQANIILNSHISSSCLWGKSIRWKKGNENFQ